MSDENEPISELRTIEVDGPVEIRNASKRELDMRLVPWDTPIDTLQGRELFRSGAFDGLDPANTYLVGSEHEAHLGLGQDGTPRLARRPTGKAIAFFNQEDGGYATFRVAKTAAGDEQLALATEGIVAGVSMEFGEVPGGSETQQISGRRTRIHKRVTLPYVTTTYRPAYAQAGVIAVRAETEPEPPAEAEVAPVAEPEAPVTGAVENEVAASVRASMESIGTTVESFAEKFTDRIEKLEERSRSQFTIPSDEPKPKANRADWISTVLKLLSGERVPELQIRALDDLITTDNAGVVPDAISSELIGVIDPSRPFMQSTRRMDTPASGLTLTVPVITQRPTVAKQSTQKTEVDSTKTLIGTTDFVAETYAGGGDISLQLLKRSSPSFLSLYLELLAEAYGLTTEAAAVANLNAAGIGSGGALDPEALALGSAWSSAVGSAFKRGPDTIWMSSAAVAAFIDAKADGTNAPLYSQLSANFTAGGGVGGSIQGLRAVYVPALDATANDVIVGPSRGFAWAEDGTFVLQVDNPALAGRDVAMVGIVWFAAMYPAAFTAYSVTGGGS